MKRRSGVLLPLTSLPSRFGIGDLGPEALEFAKFLHEAGQSLWQVLPLTATDPGCGNSPYSPTSAFAGSPLLVSPEELAKSGLLDEGDLRDIPDFDPAHVDYKAAAKLKTRLLRRAWARFRNEGHSDYEAFCGRERHWLEDHSLFAAIKESRGRRPWSEWPEGLRFREPGALEAFGRKHADDVGYHSFVQYVFSIQLAALRERMARLGVGMVGDVPVYVTRDCSDVWQHPELFDLDEELNPVSVAGVPPDYFSAKGQLWGNPLYNWEAMRAGGFRWWIDRLRRLFAFFDLVRIDHFRGLVAYWSIPADAETAERGEWRDAPCREFFARIREEFPNMPLWAENLGVITPDVEDLRTSMGLPGMLVLQFAFGNPWENPYAPHNHTPVNVVYTGTHDNNTSRGWFREDASPSERENLEAYLGRSLSEETAAGELARMALASVAETAVIPMQDWLAVDSRGRINIPSTPSGNWTWRMAPGEATPELARRMRELTALYGRTERP